MKTFALTLALLTGTAVSADASSQAAVFPKRTSSPRFVGVTPQRFSGGGTRAAMMAACHKAFPGSRMALSDEYALSVNPAPIPEAAWIQPHIAVSRFNPGTLLPSLDSVGNQVYAESNCDGWTSDASDSYFGGTLLLPSGAVSSGDPETPESSCAASHPVACVVP